MLLRGAGRWRNPQELLYLCGGVLPSQLYSVVPAFHQVGDLHSPRPFETLFSGLATSREGLGWLCGCEGVWDLIQRDEAWIRRDEGLFANGKERIWLDLCTVEDALQHYSLGFMILILKPDS